MRMMEFLKSNESGSAMVETALTFPILIALLFGAVELGEVAYASIETTAAARAGAQYAAMHGGGYNDSSGITLAAENDAYDTYSPRPANFSVNPTTSCVCSDTTACTLSSGVYSCSTGAPVVTVTVQTTASFPAPVSIPGLFSSNTFTLHGYAQQEVLQ